MDHLPIRVNTLRGDQKIDFDVYIQIGPKLIHYLAKGDSFEGTRLTRLKAKKLKRMFIKPEDEAAYRTYVERNIEMAYDEKSGKSLQDRAEIVQGQQQSNAEEIFENPQSEEAYSFAKDSVGRYVGFLQSNPGAVQAVISMENGDQSLSHHGVGVATLAVAVSQKMGIADAKLSQLMTLGALIHDIGHADSVVDIRRERTSFTPEEMEIYLRHVDVGVEKARDQKHFDQLVLNIIGQHEEMADGSGFPQKLQAHQMDPMVAIVATCNAIDRLITYEGVPKAEAAKKMILERVGKHPLVHLQKLTEILKDG